MNDDTHTFLSGVRMKLGQVYEIGCALGEDRHVFSGWYGGARPMLTHPGMGHVFHTGGRVIAVTADSIYRVERLSSNDLKAGR